MGLMDRDYMRPGGMRAGKLPRLPRRSLAAAFRFWIARMLLRLRR
jgi:hypothetical protein